MSPKKKGASDRVILQNSIKTLAANIHFASVDNPVVTLAITSTVPNEGKSSIALSLSAALASGGKDVLLVDCDMRRRSLAGLMGVHPRSGLYSVLSDQVSLDEAIVETNTPGLYFLDTEPHIPNPVDLLSSRRFAQFVKALRREYDYVVFDTPPLSTFVDAAVIGSIVDGTLLVVRQNFAKRDELLAAYDQLKKADANVIGSVMNYCEIERGERYYNYYSHESQQAGADAPQANAAPQRPVRKAAPAPAPVPEPEPAQSNLRPISAPAAPAAKVSPDTTAQFLAAARYQQSSYPVDE